MLRHIFEIDRWYPTHSAIPCLGGTIFDKGVFLFIGLVDVVTVDVMATLWVRWCSGAGEGSRRCVPQ